MSLARNAAANYVGQFYIAGINIIVVPFYITHLGIESYGLVGVFTMMQAWFQMLDLGMSPTLGREVARFRGGAMSGLEVRRLLRAMEGVFYVVAIVAGTLIVAMSNLIAAKWLRVEHLPLEVVATAVKLMGLTVAARWISGIYRSAITGFEEQVWLNGFNIVVATIRAAVVVPVLAFGGIGIVGFFVFQLAVSVLEGVVLAWKTYAQLPAEDQPTGFSLGPLRGVMKFSLIVAFSAVVWVLVSQTDRLILSKTLPLPEFGTFTLGVLVAGTVGLAAGPITQALLPRLALLAAERNERGVLELYSRATQWVCTLSAPLAVTLALFARPALGVWTGSLASADGAAPILTLYALGNGALAIASFPYYLQYASGNLRTHLAGLIGFLVVLVPLIAWASSAYGALGAGTAWVAHSTLFALSWTWFVHRRLAPGLHGNWLLRRVLPSWGTVGVVGVLLRWCLPQFSGGRVATAFALAAVGLVLLFASLLTHPEFRTRLLSARLSFPRTR